MTPQQQKWIVDHMGHTLDVHNIHYRCTSDIIERADIAKLLMLMDRKQVGYFKNKKLEEISLEGNSLAAVLYYITQRTMKIYPIYVTNFDNIPNFTWHIFLFSCTHTSH